jgi:hypothetical protein
MRAVGGAANAIVPPAGVNLPAGVAQPQRPWADGQSGRLSVVRQRHSLRRKMALPPACEREISHIDHVAAFTVE